MADSLLNFWWSYDSHRFDELRRVEKKARGDSAVILESVNEMFERNEYDNPTKLAGHGS